MDIVLIALTWFLVGVYVGMWAAKSADPEKKGGAK